MRLLWRRHGQAAPPSGDSALENAPNRSEEHTSELQSRLHLVCRLLLEKNKRPPTAEWGIMVAEGAGFMVSGEWWIALFPGLALMIAVFCFNLLGDGLRDIVDLQRRTL